MVDPFMSSSWEAVSYHLTVDAFFFFIKFSTDLPFQVKFIMFLLHAILLSLLFYTSAKVLSASRIVESVKNK